MRPGGGRSVAMISSFLRDRPAKRPQTGVRGSDGRRGRRLTAPTFALHWFPPFLGEKGSLIP